MTWTRLDENFPQHPKIIAAGERAELLHIHALIYCNRFLTDGVIPEAVVPTLTRSRSWVQPSVETLVKLGVWVKTEEGFQVHDFLEYQPSKAKVLAERKRKASAGQAGGLARARGLLLETPQAKPKPVPVPVSVPVSVPSNDSKQEGLVTENESSPNGDLALSSPNSKDLVHQIFEAWRQMWHSAARLTRKRRAFIQARLHEGWSVEDLVLAVTVGAANDPWDKRHLAFNDDLKYLLKDGESVEKFLGFVNETPGVYTEATRQGERLTKIIRAGHEAGVQ